MKEVDIVYIKGNPNSGLQIQHEKINLSIIKLISSYSYKIVDSDKKNIDFLKDFPKAKIYIAFSRGSRYLKKLPNSSLKISIGGIKGAKIHQFLNEKDEILKGNLSEESMAAHFIIEKHHKELIQKLIANAV